jgi:hypothetical protein
MHTQYRVVDDLHAWSAVDRYRAQFTHRSEIKIIKDFAAGPPDNGRAIFLLTFVIESIDLGDLPRLVVSSKQRHSFRVPLMRQTMN